MDSVTQMALGASLGEAVLGRRVGRKAMAWGALAGTLPDLDVVVAPFVSEAAALYFHRSLTHSLFFAFVAAPLLGWLVSRLYRRRGGAEADARGWTLLFFAALWTHPMLDWLTVYGTQVFWPLTDHPYASGALFIIDPLYTVPLLVALGRSLFASDARVRRRWNVAGLTLSTLYALWAFGAHAYVERLAWQNLRAQGLAGEVETVQVSAAPLNTLAWNVLARSDSTLWRSRYAFAEDDAAFAFEAEPRRWQVTASAEGSEALATIAWFSKGYGLARPAEGEGFEVYDARFGSAVGAASGEEAYVFTFRFFRDEAGRWTFEQRRPEVDLEATLAQTWRRVLGLDPAPHGR